LERALELNPNNARAHDLLAEMSREPVIERASFMRVLWPSVLVATALAAVTAILLRRRATQPI
jgi:hypothetical protein